MNKKQLKYYSQLLNEYISLSNGVCMAEYLAGKLISFESSLSFEEVFEIYIRLMKEANGDRFYTIKEGELIEL